MKKILTTLILAALMIPATANVTFYIFGYVTSTENSSPVPNHPVTILSDSTFGYLYYKTVYTDIAGFYADTIESTADSGIMYVQTFDCNNNLLQSQIFYSPNNLNFQEDFVICTVPCNAEFTYQSTADSLTIHFTDLSAGAMTKWIWNFGDGTSETIDFPSNPNVTHTYQASGNYTVCLTVQNSDMTCVDTVCHEVIVGTGQGCNADFTWYADSTGTSTGIHFIDQSQGNIITWNWSFGDGTYGSGQNPYHIFNSSGVYLVCLTIQGADSMCYDTQCYEVTVGGSQDCTNYFEYNAVNLTVSFLGHINNGFPGTYSWDFGDGQYGQGQSITHTYAYPANFAVVLTTIDSTGCQYTTWQSVHVGDTTTFHQIWGQVFEGSFTMNSGTVMIFSVDSTGNYFPYSEIMTVDSSGIYWFSYIPDGDYYIWAVPYSPDYLPTYYGDVVFWEDATVITLGEPANPYDIHLVPAPGLNAGNGTINGHINAGNFKSGYADKISMLIENESGEVLSSTPVSSSGDFIFAQLASGVYFLLAELPGCPSDKVRVELTPDNPSVNVTMTMVNGKILGTGDHIPLLTSVLIYPNPVREDLSVTVDARENQPVSLDILNMTGERMLSRQIMLNKGETKISVPLTNIPAGIYVVHIYNGQGINILEKVVKAR